MDYRGIEPGAGEGLPRGIEVTGDACFDGLRQNFDGFEHFDHTALRQEEDAA